MPHAGFPKNQFKLHSMKYKVKDLSVRTRNEKNNKTRMFKNRVHKWRARKGYK